MLVGVALWMDQIRTCGGLNKLIGSGTIWRCGPVGTVVALLNEVFYLG